jgi:predicted SnoaL-like aldol condensation-catalyzing enzyme
MIYSLTKIKFMKKNFFAVSATLLCICISCNDSSTASVEGKDNSQAQKNLNAWHVVSMAFATGNPNAVDSVIADDYIDHKITGDVKGRDSVKANVARMHANIKDKKMETIKEIADNDYGFFWMRFTGSRNNVKGGPAEPFDFSSIQVVKFKDGKASEHWEFMETGQLMKMMQQRGMNKMDSSKMKNK